jgi:hypothetical protein
MIRHVDKENSSLKMEIFIRDFLKMIKQMDLESITLQMEINMKDIFKIINFKVKVNLSIKIRQFSKGNFKKE